MGFVTQRHETHFARAQPKASFDSERRAIYTRIFLSATRLNFFEENGTAVTVNSVRYINVINNFVVPELRMRRISRHNLWFQQDGATAHTARASMEASCRTLFPNRVVSRLGDIHWPPRSPDRSTRDFFLWGYLKSRVHEGNPRTLQKTFEHRNP